MREGPPPLAERRARLIALAASQRRSLVESVEPWRGPLSIADRGLAAARFIGRHRALTVGTAVAASVALRAAGLGPWLRHGLLAWQFVRRFRGAVAQR